MEYNKKCISSRFLKRTYPTFKLSTIRRSYISQIGSFFVWQINPNLLPTQTFVALYKTSPDFLFTPVIITMTIRVSTVWLTLQGFFECHSSTRTTDQVPYWQIGSKHRLVQLKAMNKVSDLLTGEYIKEQLAAEEPDIYLSLVETKRELKKYTTTNKW